MVFTGVSVSPTTDTDPGGDLESEESCLSLVSPHHTRT